MASCPSVPWTSAARPPPFEAALPRPSAPGSDVHEVVAEILRQVRAEGDEAVVRYTAELDRVDVSDGLRVPADEIEKACADADPDLWRALEVAFGRILAYHAHEGTPPATWSRAASRCGT